jgi:hypothetical protein
MTGRTSSDRASGRAAARAASRSASSDLLKNRMYPAAANAIIRRGTAARTVKNVTAAAKWLPWRSW